MVLPRVLHPNDVALFCDRARRLLEIAPADRLICEVRELGTPDLAAVDALARLCLTARRLGCRVELRGACPELRDLLGLVGLAGVVICEGDPAALGLEAGRQAEQREEPRGVEEERDPCDAVV